MTQIGRTRFIGMSPEDLSIRERRQLTGVWAAYLMYTPENLALRRIEALGDSPEECASFLHGKGLNPADYEYLPIAPAY